MTPAAKGLVVAMLHVVLVASLGGKLLYDRRTLPRVWALAAPIDPTLPIRGRYVSLRLLAEPRGIDLLRGPVYQPAILRVADGRLIAEAPPADDPDAPGVYVFVRRQEPQAVAVVQEPVAFFIPERVPDPSMRAAGEELWVEVTVPRTGPPRPIRLGVRRDGGEIVPLPLD